MQTVVRFGDDLASRLVVRARVQVAEREVYGLLAPVLGLLGGRALLEGLDRARDRAAQTQRAVTGVAFGAAHGNRPKTTRSISLANALSRFLYRQSGMKVSGLRLRQNGT